MSDPDTGNILYISGGSAEIPFESIIIRNNVMYGTYDDYSDTWTGAAIYVANARVEVYGNVIKDVNTVLTRSTNNGGDSYLYNNTVVNVKGNHVLSGYVKQMHNNIFPHSSYFVTGGTVQGNNVFIDQHGAENIFVEPQAGDYRLREGSPAINAGVWLDYMQYERDMRGVLVSRDDDIDAGALQYTEGEATAPPRPTGLDAEAGDAQVVLTWNPTPTATGYEVKRFESGDPHEVIATPATHGYTDTDVANGVTYYYIVVAVNEVGKSPDSAQVSATPSEEVVPTEWAGFEIHEGQWVDTGAWFGSIHVQWTPWNYVEANQGWIYLPEDHVEDDGAWVFTPRGGRAE